MIFSSVNRGARRSKVFALSSQPWSARVGYPSGVPHSFAANLRPNISNSASSPCLLDGRSLGPSKSVIGVHFSKTQEYSANLVKMVTIQGAKRPKSALKSLTIHQFDRPYAVLL